MKILVLLGLMMNVMITGCVKTTSTLVPAEKISNIAYGSDPLQVYDIYLPANRNDSSTKVMFMFHPGSWSGGDKMDFNHYIDSLKKYLPDYAYVNVNYRLANYTINQFPTQEMDVKKAVEYVMERSAEYMISKKVVFLGASAGAHLALLQAYKYPGSIKAKAVVSYFGPTDMTDMYNNPASPQIPFWLAILLGSTPLQNKQIYEQSSPIKFVTAGSPPTLLFQGGKDSLVNPLQAVMLQKKLDSAGVVNELVMYPEEGHGWIGSALTDSFIRTARFLQSHVQ